MRLRKRGIVLIGILVLTLLATFFVGALLQMNPTRLRRTVQDERHDHAAAAARAGVEYCLGQLAEDQAWKGQGNGITVKSENMVVREDRGNVTGWVRAENGEWAGFRLRFNWQEGDGGGDGLDQPQALMETAAISLNNLRGEARAIPLGRGPNYSYTADQPGGFTVPENSVALVVEGMVGPGIDPNGVAIITSPGAGAQTTVRTLEGIYTVSGFSEGMPDGAVLQAGGDSHFTLGSGTSDSDDLSGYLRLTASDQTAIMRTKGKSTIAQGPGKNAPFNFYPDMHADVRVGRPGFNPNTKAGQEFSRTAEAPSAALMEIEWDKVAESDQPDRLLLPAGVYTVGGGDTDSTDLSRVKYYPMTFGEYRQKLINGQTPQAQDVPKGFLDCVALNGRDWTAPDGTEEKRDLITFDRDIEVQTVKGNKDLAIIPVNGAKQKSVSDLTSTIPASEFATSPSVSGEDKSDTGRAILRYLATAAGTDEVTFALDGQQYTYNKLDQTLSSGNPADIALGVLGGGQLSFQAPVSQLPGTLPGDPSPFGGGGGVSAGSSAGEGSEGGAPQTYLASSGSGGFTKGGPLEHPGVELDGGGGGSTVILPIGSQESVASVNGASVTGGTTDRGWQIADPNAFMAAVGQTEPVPDSVLAKNVDPFAVPETAGDDRTVPQDLEINFAPSGGESAAIRTQGNVILGTHLSGQGGSVVAGGRIDLIGLGIDLNAGQGERDGVSLYSQKDITVSTYDQRRNKYWDASIKGVIFAKGNLTVRLGETVIGGDEPPWGSFDYMGAAIVLGDAPAFFVPPLSYQQQTGPIEMGGGDISKLGNAAMIAKGIRLFYEPKFLVPYLEAERLIPIFGTVSVVEK